MTSVTSTIGETRIPLGRRILIAGATGFTGRHVVGAFQESSRDFRLRLFVRSEQRLTNAGLNDSGHEVTIGTFEQPETLISALKDRDTFICLASLGFGHAQTLVDACKSAGVKRAIFTSTTGIFTKLNPSSKAIRLQAEKIIRDSGLDFTIVRPTMIHGTRDDRNICRLVRYVKRWPALPVAGPGTFKVQPVYVKDLARAFVQISESPDTIGKEYNLSGADAVSYNDLVKTIARLLNKKIVLLPIPLWAMIPPFRLYEHVAPNPRLKVEQLLRLNENKAFGHENAERDFGYRTTPLNEALSQEIEDMGFAG